MIEFDKNKYLYLTLGEKYIDFICGEDRTTLFEYERLPLEFEVRYNFLVNFISTNPSFVKFTYNDEEIKILALKYKEALDITSTNTVGKNGYYKIESKYLSVNDLKAVIICLLIQEKKLNEIISRWTYNFSDLYKKYTQLIDNQNTS